MQAERHPWTTARRDTHRRRSLRSAVLRLGSLLGWPPRDVIAFTEALSGRRWRHCATSELQLVIGEYQQLAAAIAARRARRRDPLEGRKHAARG